MMKRLDDPRFDDGSHADAVIEEWVFAAWNADGTLGVVLGHRIIGRIAWYWAASAGSDAHCSTSSISRFPSAPIRSS